MKKTGFVHLHVHSEFSPFDGLSQVPEMIREAQRLGHPAIAMTDHGTCAGHPYLGKEANNAGIKPIFGIEAYLVNDRFDRSDRGYYHLTLLAKNDDGLQNIWAASTESYREGYYGKPRMDWDTLRRHREGVIALSGCLSGPLAEHLKVGRGDLAKANLGRLMEIFEDDLYLEIMPNSIEEQYRVNRDLVEISREFGVPLVATVDSHFPTKGDYQAHQVWIACQVNKGVDEDRGVFGEGGDDLYLKSEEEVREGLSYLPDDAVDEAVRNTVLIADQCDAEIRPRPVVLHYSKSRNIKDDDRTLLAMCLANWSKVAASPVRQEVYLARLEREFKLIKRKGFSPYFLMVSDYSNWARENGLLVGPGRGSAAASLVAYLVGITGIDPVRHNLLFERFLTEGRSELPDIDMDFTSADRERLQSYVRDRYGEDYVVRVGTHLRLKNKGAFQRLFSALKSRLPESSFLDSRKIAEIIDDAEADTAGLGLSWEGLNDKAADALIPFREKYEEVFHYAARIVGRLHSYGRHAAGMAISTEFPVTQLPLRIIDDGTMVTQFEMQDLERLGLVKFDLLTIATLDKIRATLELIYQRTGKRIDLHTLTYEDMNDPKIWDFLANDTTVGVFQVDTPSGTRMVQRMKPRSIDEMSALVALVRPGPMNSGLTDMYLRRRAGVEEVTYAHPKLEQITKDTFGCIVYQEQVMQACIDLAGFTSDEADKVRKVLGKKLTDQIAEQGEKFVRQAEERGIGREVTEPLWSQITEFAKYGFNKSHSFAYAVVAFWTLYLKYHYPAEFYAGAMSQDKKEKIPEYVRDAQRRGIKVLPQDINVSERDFTVKDGVIRYGIGAIKGIGGAAVDVILEAREKGGPFVSFADFRERAKHRAVTSRVVTLLAQIGAFDSLPDARNRNALLARLEADQVKGSKNCKFRIEDYEGEGLPCSFNWAEEDFGINPKTGKGNRPKPPPKRCTVRCRQYTPPPPIRDEDVKPPTKWEIRAVEKELLGVYLTSTPFDDIEAGQREHLRSQALQIASGPLKVYTVVGLVSGLRTANDRNGNEYGRWKIETEVGDLDVISFSRKWAAHKGIITNGAFILAEVEKRERGLQLKSASKVY